MTDITRRLERTADYYESQVMNKDDDGEGHWITLDDGRHIFIGAPGGYVPAKTREEAERFAKGLLNPEYVKHAEEWNAGANHQQIKLVSYRGVELDIANRINAEIARQQELYNVPKFNTIIAKPLPSQPGVIARVAGSNLELNTLVMGSMDKLNAASIAEKRFYDGEGERLLAQLKLNEDKMTPRDLAFMKSAEKRLLYSREVVGYDIESTIQHESFHLYARGYSLPEDQREPFREEMRDAIQQSLNSEYKYKVSAYGGENLQHVEEHAAESYVVYQQGDYDDLHPTMLGFFKKWF